MAGEELSPVQRFSLPNVSHCPMIHIVVGLHGKCVFVILHFVTEVSRCDLAVTSGQTSGETGLWLTSIVIPV